MQDRYSGDVGDFGKFSLLRNLLPRNEFKIGVVWYLYPDESHNNDGRHIEYLKNPEYLTCDGELRDKLKLITGNMRSVSELEHNGILPNNTVYYSEQLNFHNTNSKQTQSDKTARLNSRLKWLNDAVETVSDCNAVFLDPDNGLEIKSCNKRSMIKSGKFAYYTEVNSLFKNKDICIIYHHMNMNSPHPKQIEDRILELRNKVNPSGKIFSARFKPYSPRAYFILTRDIKEQSVYVNLKNFLNSPCGVHWDCYSEG